MANQRNQVAVEPLVEVLKEALWGPRQSWTYFIEQRPTAGLLGTLEQLSAGEASRPCAGSSIAAHAAHVIVGLKASTAWIHGLRTSQASADNWTAEMVDDATWSQIQAELRQRGEELSHAIALHAASSTDAMRRALGAVAHVVYHWGAIRQKVAALGLSDTAVS